MPRLPGPRTAPPDPSPSPPSPPSPGAPGPSGLPDLGGLGPLGRLGRLAHRRRGRVVLLWVAALVGALVLSVTASGEFEADYSVPGSDSRQAQDLLQQRFPAASGDTVDVVVRSEGPVTAPEVRADVAALLAELGGAPHVAAVEDPYAQPGSVSADGRTALGHLRLDVVNPVDVPVEDAEEMLAIAEAAERPGLEVALGGQVVAQAQQGEVGSEAIGLAAATVVLLLVFGSVVAAGLPLLVALGGLAVSGLLTGVVAGLVAVPDWSTSLATMMGIGIGIDYALLMVTRYREWREAGLGSEEAAGATLDTAGRAVVVAGTTVVVSMLGLFAMGLTYMRGAALVTILAVLVVLAASVTLFPALLGYLGRHVDRLRLPLPRRARARAAGHAPSPRWTAWSRTVQRHRVLAAVAGVAALLVLAAPALGLRFGFPDAGNDPVGTSTRTAYDLVADGFGPGANGPLLLAAELGRPGDTAALDPLRAALAATPGVASVTPAQPNPAGDTAVLTVVPTSGPQSSATEDLVHRLRDDVVPAATAGTGALVHVGGVTASAVDSNEDVASRLPLLIGGVVALSVLLLVAAFRSVVVALTAAVMNLLSIAAAYGVVALVLQGGWAGQLVGIDGETPLPAFIPVLMFAVLFGLSMDYEVFLVARMREAWVRTGDNAGSVLAGLAGTARVITAAAAIMVVVFGAFVPSPAVFLKVIGIGLAAAILVDATVVRLLLVPAAMHLLGRANWWMPRWLDRAVPALHVEGRLEVPEPAPAPAPRPEGAPQPA
ncbi:MMPL family transporter [Vallicoccus soli]|uniref:MMPL family transporter n=1 Tax=Vallicoccus soli TaxID=2339232 RepID=A0A3A3Z3Q7_9ACTN|nr:MMPL family transporter [Vallicoccus soli]RJK97538.1 MMPL family transporter [Vallicoccus soli]